MCGRYYIDKDTEEEIYRALQEIDEKFMTERTGDIYPTNYAPVIYGRDEKLCGGEMRWGFFGKDKRLMINARAETALERPTFSDSVRQRRCIIPARHFYEWDKERQKVTFCRKQGKILYMAGFYREQEDGPHFVILTTAANESVSPVHERMPLILEEDEMLPWIYNAGKVGSFLTKSSPKLERRQDYEQMSLF